MQIHLSSGPSGPGALFDSFRDQDINVEPKIRDLRLFPRIAKLKTQIDNSNSEKAER
jgi:hypothetical protein